jgi:hypothetical protein
MSNAPSIAVTPRGLRNLPSTTPAASGTGTNNDRSSDDKVNEWQLLQREATSIEQWWQQDLRWKYTKRVYSGM